MFLNHIKYKAKSVFVKQIIGFLIGNIIIVMVTTGIFVSAIHVAQEESYDKMRVQSRYYLDLLDAQLEHIYTMQLNFFTDRRLAFLLTEKSMENMLNGYEKRDALLSLQEKLQAIEGSSNMIENICLFIPGTNYYITPVSVKKIGAKEQEELDFFLLNREPGFHFTEKYMYSLMAKGQVHGQAYPANVVVIMLSQKKIETLMNQMNQGSGSGADFWYDGKQILGAEENEEKGIGKTIFSKLVRNADGKYAETQRMKVDGKYYLTCVSESQFLGTFVQYTQEAPLMAQITHLRYLLYFAWIVFSAVTIFFIIYTQILIHKPIAVLLRAFERVQSGNLEEKIHYTGDNEFASLFDGFNQMEDKIKILLAAVTEQTNLAQKAELKQLQSQINPHFLYNSLFALKSRIYREEYESAGELADLLGNYFRYLTRTGEDYLPLKQEAEHAYYYAAIQKSRFSRRIQFSLDKLPESAEEILVPRLILQPLLENVLQHGLEDKESGGVLHVGYRKKDRGLEVFVEDNGDNLSDIKLEKMQHALVCGRNDAGEVTGIINIHRRLQLYSGGKSGLRLERSGLGGLLVIIYLNQTAVKEAPMKPAFP